MPYMNIAADQQIFANSKRKCIGDGSNVEIDANPSGRSDYIL